MGKSEIVTVNEPDAARYLRALGLSWRMLQGKEVLDLGAGNGLFAQAAHRRGVAITALDKNPSSWKGEGNLCQRGINYVQGQAEHLPFRDEAFDLIVAMGTFNFFIPPEILHEARRVVKPGGEFRFGTGLVEVLDPNQERNSERLDALEEKELHGLQLTPEEKREMNRLEEWIDDQVDFTADTSEELERAIRISLRHLEEFLPGITIEHNKQNLFYKFKKPSDDLRSPFM